MESLTEKQFQEFIKKHRSVIVDFWADWCLPCEYMAKQVLEPLVKEYGEKVKFAKINVDKSPKLVSKLEISAIPTVIIFKEGKEKARFVGFKPNVKDELEKELVSLLK